MCGGFFLNPNLKNQMRIPQAVSIRLRRIETISNLTTERFSRKEIMQAGFFICAVDFFGIYTQNSIPVKPVNA